MTLEHPLMLEIHLKLFQISIIVSLNFFSNIYKKEKSLKRREGLSGPNDPLTLRQCILKRLPLSSEEHPLLFQDCSVRIKKI